MNKCNLTLISIEFTFKNSKIFIWLKALVKGKVIYRKIDHTNLSMIKPTIGYKSSKKPTSPYITKRDTRAGSDSSILHMTVEVFQRRNSTVWRLTRLNEATRQTHNNITSYITSNLPLCPLFQTCDWHTAYVGKSGRSWNNPTLHRSDNWN